MKFILCTILAIIGIAVAKPSTEISPPQTLIVNGEDADLTPYHVHIFARHAAISKSGAGALITPRHILTAGSLIKGYSSWEIGYGDTIFGKLKKVTSSLAFFHPLYEQLANSSRHDIGVIYLPMNLNSSIAAPIRLPNFQIRLPRLYEEGHIVGFSTTNYSQTIIESNAVLKSAYLMVRERAYCNILYPTNETFCASDRHHLANVCHKDLGSAFAVRYRGNTVLSGITISVSNSCGRNDISHYLRIQTYLEWIEAITNTVYCVI